MNAWNCTLTGNVSSADGGGADSEGYLSLVNCTFFGNPAGSRGGSVFSGGSVLAATNCIFLNGGIQIIGTPQFQIINSVFDTTTLAPLGNYGGPTQTMPPLPGSSALDEGIPIPGLATDQRGS